MAMMWDHHILNEAKVKTHMLFKFNVDVSANYDNPFFIIFQQQWCYLMFTDAQKKTSPLPKHIFLRNHTPALKVQLQGWCVVVMSDV